MTILGLSPHPLPSQRLQRFLGARTFRSYFPIAMSNSSPVNKRPINVGPRPFSYERKQRRRSVLSLESRPSVRSFYGIPNGNGFSPETINDFRPERPNLKQYKTSPSATSPNLHNRTSQKSYSVPTYPRLCRQNSKIPLLRKFRIEIPPRPCSTGII